MDSTVLAIRAGMLPYVSTISLHCTCLTILDSRCESLCPVRRELSVAQYCLLPTSLVTALRLVTSLVPTADKPGPSC